MSEVKKWVSTSSHGGMIAVITNDPSSTYVRYDDYAAEKARADAAEAALDHIARVALGSRSRTNRMLWIAQRAKSALNGDEVWKQAQQPRGYHEALERTAMQAGGEVEGG